MEGGGWRMEGEAKVRRKAHPNITCGEGNLRRPDLDIMFMGMAMVQFTPRVFVDYGKR